MVETRRRSPRQPAASTDEEPEAKRQRATREKSKQTQDDPKARHETDGKPRQSGEWDDFFRQHFFLQAPPELYAVYELARELSPDNPLDAFLPLGVRLSGPFEVLRAAADGSKEILYSTPLFMHGRFPNDPPEVLTTFVDVESPCGQHWGYFRDSPDQEPRYAVLSPDSSKVAFEIAGVGLLGVLASRLEHSSKKTPASLRSKLTDLVTKIYGNSTVSIKELKRQREREQTAASLHGLGIVVPVNSKTETGFRELPIAGPALKSLLEDIQSNPSDATLRAKISELLTRSTIASDECDFGTGLLLGLDLLTAGPCLQKEAFQLLRVAYGLLGRGAFFKVIKQVQSANHFATSQICAVAQDPNLVPAPKTAPLPPQID